MLTVRHITTTTDAQDVVSPVLDKEGREIEEWSVAVPREIEIKGGEAVDAYVTEELARRAAPTAAPTADAGHQEPTA